MAARPRGEVCTRALRRVGAIDEGCPRMEPAHCAYMYVKPVYLAQAEGVPGPRMAAGAERDKTPDQRAGMRHSSGTCCSGA